MPLILKCEALMFVETRKSKTGKLMVHAQAVSRNEMYRLMSFADGKDGDPKNAPLYEEQLRTLEAGQGPHYLEVSALDGGSFWVRRVLDSKGKPLA